MIVEPIKKTQENTGKIDHTINRPNILIIMVDEQRFPPVYEDESIKKWRAENLMAQNFLYKNGVVFQNHYVGSTACSPSRATLYTGQYPSLHGVTQTDGGGSTAFSPDVFWLDPNTVPTFGDYLRTGGYKTYWKGKWHASHGDIVVPGTHDSFLSYMDETGVPIPENEQIYLESNKLSEFGFDGWIGPEPHGSSPHNSGSSAANGLSGRDQVYSSEVIELLKALQYNETLNKDNQKPWAIVASFVNPHDIALYGAYSKLMPSFNFEIDNSIPYIPPSPTAYENLDTKPIVQPSYRHIYPRLIQPLADTENFRKLYYSLQLNVDREIYKVLTTLQNSIFYDNTIIIYTSDHGDLLGSHGGLFQKWYQSYEEAIHVPLIIHNPKLVPQHKSVNTLTSHVDILPTILGLTNIDVTQAQEELKNNHNEVHPLVGRDLTPLILSRAEFINQNEPIYFMTDDDPSITLNSSSFLGIPYEPVSQPSHIETVIVKLPTGKNGNNEIWKYSRYFDNPQFWSKPGCENKFTIPEGIPNNCGDTQYKLCATTIKTQPVPDEFEMYNITADPLETINLANPKFETTESKVIRTILMKLLSEECKKKRLYPTSGNVIGKPSCKSCTQPLLNV